MIPLPPSSLKNRTSKPLLQREKVPLYFLACEGGSEIQYFKSLHTFLWQNNISVQFRYLDRTYSEQKRTLPTELLQLIYDEKYISDSREISIEQIILKADQWLRETKILPDYRIFPDAPQEIIQQIQQYKYYIGMKLRFEDIESGRENQFFEILNRCITSVLQSAISRYDSDDFKKYFQKKMYQLGYEDGDHVCLICDRDFYEDAEYENTLKQCSKYGIHFYPTNPCFEFWILLHFSLKNMKIDWKKMLLNPMMVNPSTGRKVRYSLYSLQRIFPEYSKRDIHFEKLQARLVDAISNEKRFSEDAEELKTMLGSRVGKFVSELLSLQKAP